LATNIGQRIGRVARGAIHLGRFDFSVDADLESCSVGLVEDSTANAYEIYGAG